MNNTDFRVVLRKIAYPVAIGIAISSAFPNGSFALGTDEQRAACTPDVFRLCSSEIPNVDRIIVCMTVKKASLSPACRAAVFNPERARKSGPGRTEPVHY